MGLIFYRLPSPHHAMFQYLTGTRGVREVPSVSLRLYKYRVMQQGKADGTLASALSKQWLLGYSREL